jgi:capsular polysaccharide biosynthesis protein
MLAQNADEIVGMHGANLTNVMFMKKGSRVVELLPKKKESNDAYKRLSHIFGLEYQRLALIKSGPGGYDLENIRPHFRSS